MKRLISLWLIGICFILSGCSGEPISPKIDLKQLQNVGIHDRQTGQYVILQDNQKIEAIIKAYNDSKVSRDQSFETTPDQRIKVVLQDGREYEMMDGDGPKARIKLPNGETKIVKGSLSQIIEKLKIPQKSLIEKEAKVKSLGIFRPRNVEKSLARGFNLPLEKLYLQKLTGQIKPILSPMEKLESSGLYLNFYEGKFTFLELYLEQGILRNPQTNSYYQLPKETAQGFIEYYGVANIRESILVYQNNVYQAVNAAVLGDPSILEPLDVINQTTYYRKKGSEKEVPAIYFLHSKDSGKKGYYLYGVYTLYKPRGWISNFTF